jgi:prepilin-type N-terminal cleavage/methylation domain-containing protein
MMKMHGANHRDPAGAKAFTMIEVLVGVCILGIMVVSLYTGLSSGFTVVQLSRDNLRATQILLQRMETIRLYNWNQMLNTNSYLKPVFEDRYDPKATNGTIYSGRITTDLPNIGNLAYKTNMRLVTVTLYWTNYSQKPNPTTVVRSRQMQTFVARYGMQNYLYQ